MSRQQELPLEGVSQELMIVRTGMIQKDRVLKGFKSKLKTIDRLIAEAETRVPVELLDHETLEAYLEQNDLGEPTDVMAELVSRNRPLADLAALLLRKWSLERAIARRLDALVASFAPSN